jgi:L-ascorbate metabolism protein UlaG (beta-lactamase superfamily)
MKEVLLKKTAVLFIVIILASTINIIAPAELLEDTNPSFYNDSTTMDIHFKLIGGATWILTIDDLKIACDPALDPDYPERVEDPVYSDEDFENIDIWLITHDHFDHIDEIGLTKIEPESLIITHKIAADDLKATNSSNINELKWKEKKTIEIEGFKVTIEAIPAIHAVNPLLALTIIGGNGYWITLEKFDQTLDFYVSGDTVPKWVVLKSLRGRKADLFIPNMGCARAAEGILGLLFGPLTMNARMMKRMKNILKPEITIPVHFGTFSHYSEPISVVEKWNDPSVKILKPGEEIIVEK